MKLSKRFKLAWRLFKEPHLYYPSLTITGMILDAQEGKTVNEKVVISYSDGKPDDVITITASK